MKVLEINSVPYGSTCRIMMGVADELRREGIDVDLATGYSTHPLEEIKNERIKIGGVFSKFIHQELARITGWNGYFSLLSTWKLIVHIKKEKYDIIHLHNVHGWYLNLPLFFRFLKKENIRVIWTLHDCWSFTGQCAHFTMIHCDKWKNACYNCRQKKRYPETMIDRSARLYQKKKEWFSNLNATLVTPSLWLKKMVELSYLKDYPIVVINNGIDLSVFKPVDTSSVQKKYELQNKKVILAVSLGWSESKGLDVICDLSDMLPDDYAMIIVGGDENTDKILPANVISIHRTQNQQELVELYSCADIFINPTREDTFPTVNIEALACGTPVITFLTGGSPEIIDEKTGRVVSSNDVHGMYTAIMELIVKSSSMRENCVARAQEYDRHSKLMEYVKLFR